MKLILSQQAKAYCSLSEPIALAIGDNHQLWQVLTIKYNHILFK